MIKNILFKVKNFLLLSLFLLFFLFFNLNNTISTKVVDESFDISKTKKLQEKLNSKINNTIQIIEKESTYNFYKEKYFELEEYYYFLDNLNVIYKATKTSPTSNSNSASWYYIYNKTYNKTYNKRDIGKKLFVVKENKIVKSEKTAIEFFKFSLKNFFNKIDNNENFKENNEKKKNIIEKTTKWNISFNISSWKYSKIKVLKFLKTNLKNYLKESNEKNKKLTFKENSLYMYFSPKTGNSLIASFSWYQDKHKTAQIIYKLNSEKNKVVAINCFGIEFTGLNIPFNKDKNTFETWKIILILVGVLIIIIFTVWLKLKDSRW